MHSPWSICEYGGECTEKTTTTQSTCDSLPFYKCGDGKEIRKEPKTHLFIGQVTRRPQSLFFLCVTVLFTIVSTLMTTASTGSLSNPIGPGRKCPQCGKFHLVAC